jgi:hypothetical protein
MFTYVSFHVFKYEGVSKSFRNDRLEPELQMVQLSATRCSCIAISRVSLVSFVAITPYVASQRAIPKVSVYFFTDSVRKLLDTTPYVIKSDIFISLYYCHMKCSWYIVFYISAAVIQQIAFNHFTLQLQVLTLFSVSRYSQEQGTEHLKENSSSFSFSLSLFKASDFSFYLWIL